MKSLMLNPTIMTFGSAFFFFLTCQVIGTWSAQTTSVFRQWLATSARNSLRMVRWNRTQSGSGLECALELQSVVYSQRSGGKFVFLSAGYCFHKPNSLSLANPWPPHSGDFRRIFMSLSFCSFRPLDPNHQWATTRPYCCGPIRLVLAWHCSLQDIQSLLGICQTG